MATYKLERLAEQWYETLLAGRSPTLPPLTWEELFDAFMTWFLLISKRADLMEEVVRLRQTPRMSITEYDTQFNKLSRFAPYFMLLML